MIGPANTLGSPPAIHIPLHRNWGVVGRGPMKSEDAKSLEARTSTKLWSASVVIGRQAMWNAVYDDSTDGDGVWRATGWERRCAE